jgi:solute carrier family 25 (mitochondrial aspartate/glutamate transporter), member 12/13
MLLNRGHVNVNFDFDCDLMTRFFGRNGKGELSYAQFTQFLKLLQEEIRRQEFYDMDNEQNGYITPQQFAAWLTSYCARDQVPAKLRRNIAHLADSFPTGSHITFAEFDAFNRIMGNITGVARSLQGATSSADGSVSRDAFISAAQRVTGITPSPLEVSIIFKMFGSPDGESVSEDKLKRENFDELVQLVQSDSDRRTAVLDLWLKDRIEPESLKELSTL